MSAIYLRSKCSLGFPVKQSHRPLLEATGASWYTIWSVPTHACHQKHRTTSGISLPNLSAVKLSFAESLKMNQQGVPLMTFGFSPFLLIFTEYVQILLKMWTLCWLEVVSLNFLVWKSPYSFQWKNFWPYFIDRYNLATENKRVSCWLTNHKSLHN